jgi:endonuclease-3
MGRARQTPFDYAKALELLRQAVGPLPKGSMFAHLRAGHTSMFEILVACVVSIRTNDRVAREAVGRLFAVASQPAELAALSETTIDRLIAPATFHDRKAATVREIARRTLRDYGGELPANAYLLQSLPGVGPVCANLAVRLARGEMFEGADIHAHRVVNRWGHVRTARLEATQEHLSTRLTPDQRIELNALMVPFGKYTCTEVEPRCSACPLRVICRQVGVTSHR